MQISQPALEPSALEGVDQWNSRARRSGIPPAFEDAKTEKAFLHEYRLAGLKSVTYACALGIATYVCIGAVDIFLGGWDPEATMRRLIAVSLLVATAAVIVAKPYHVLKSYSLLLGTLGTVTMVGLISVIHLLRDDDVSALVNPVSLLALWILYGFVRLPIGVAICVGAVASLFSMFGSRLTNMQEPGTRTLIYLIMGNALGVLLARSIEIRERQLFLQRRIAESAQAELLRRTSRAENASAEKTQLMAAVGHDLRQPMLSAVLHAGVLSQKLGVGDLAGVGRQAERVEQSVKVLGETLGHLLTATRYDAGTEPVRLEPVLLSRIFDRLRDLFDPEASTRGVSLRIREPRQGLSVTTDEQALFRVLMNLVSNGIKFSKVRPAGQAGLVVRSFLKNGNCRIVVVDNGIGIHPDRIASVWEPYVQVDNEERNRAKGLGLGLYVVRQSLQRLDRHSVSVRSAPEKGTRFVVTLQGTIEYSTEATSVLSSQGSGALSGASSNGEEVAGLSVLLIEDDQEASIAIKDQLAEWGVACVSGSTVEQVIKAWEAERVPVDRIIADFRLPGQINGTDVIRKVRELLGYNPPALLTTAEVNQAFILSVLPPDTYFLQKPFDAAALKAALHG